MSTKSGEVHLALTMEIMPRKETKNKFLNKLRSWYLENKRDFPWRYSSDPYKVLVSEVLLQKTNASKVVPIYSKFIKKYPNPQKLSNAKLSDVKKLLRSLGLLYRAERLVSIGKHLTVYCHGKVPNQIKQLLKLSGVGNYAAAAVLCFAFNKRVAIVDNNVVRLLERIFGHKSSKKRLRNDKSVWKRAESLLPLNNIKNYNYALLDFSALICTFRNPKHDVCPFTAICEYYKKNMRTKSPLE